MFRLAVLFVILISFTCQADETEVLTVDRSISKSLDTTFPNDNNLKPDISDFKIINYVLMSNTIGERWSVVSVTNLSSGNRIMRQGHLMALFANGERKNPLEHKLSFKGNETQSFTVSFGVNKFPILSVYSNNER